ncbi:MAG: hypothetical protein E7575_04005 [Ruminococcaceae bacterium]|nr:hypothetical protein [Oscillospiraceae bacterium]
MKSYAVMPMEHWQSILDAFRNKTKREKLISSGELSGLIEASSVLPLYHSVSCGQFKVSEEDSYGDFPVSHGLSCIPDVIICYSDSEKLVSGKVRGFVYMNLGEEYDEEIGYFPSYSRIAGFRDTASGITYSTGSVLEDTDRESFYVPRVGSSQYDTLCTYTWIALRFEEDAE